MGKSPCEGGLGAAVPRSRYSGTHRGGLGALKQGCLLPLVSEGNLFEVDPRQFGARIQEATAAVVRKLKSFNAPDGGIIMTRVNFSAAHILAAPSGSDHFATSSISRPQEPATGPSPDPPRRVMPTKISTPKGEPSSGRPGYNGDGALLPCR